MCAYNLATLIYVPLSLCNAHNLQMRVSHTASSSLLQEAWLLCPVPAITWTPFPPRLKPRVEALVQGWTLAWGQELAGIS